jgi:hypothetical protein
VNLEKSSFTLQGKHNAEERCVLMRIIANKEAVSKEDKKRN